MILGADKKHSKAGEKPEIIVVDANEQARRVQEAIARRAYEIFERRGSASWHELEDWGKAEAELVSPLCCGRMTVGDNLWIGTDAAVFQEGTTEIWVAPRKVTICGKPRCDRVIALRENIGIRPDGGLVFHVLDLPIEIDPSHVTAKFNGPSLEILLRKVQARPQQQAQAAAA